MDASRLKNEPPPPTFTWAGYKPLVVLVGSAVCVALFVGLNTTERTPLNWASYTRWGAPGPVEVWNGARWGLITSAFVHQAIWHIAFNLYWFWIFGRKIEFEQGRDFMLTLLLTAAFVSGAAELALGDTTGIGLSGVGYALFGFIYVRSRYDDRYRGFMTPKLVRQFVVWLFFCVALSATNILPVGNAAHFFGLAWGALVAWLMRWSAPGRYPIGLATLALAAVPTFWAPWSVTWLGNRAYNFHMAKNLPEARRYYQLVLARDPASEFARDNLALIRVHDLTT